MKTLFVTLIALLSINAYAIDTRGTAYEADETRRVQSVLVGIVEDVREVDIDERSGFSEAAGTGIGAAIGGIVGQGVGNGNGKTVATILLGVLGGIGGNAIEAKMNSAHGLEFIVTLTNGNTIAVTQAMDNDGRSIIPGDRVRIVEGKNTRVVKLRHIGATREN